MTAHTPEPLHVTLPIDGRDIPYGIDDAHGHHIADIHDNHYGNQLPVEANAHRLVNCYNACVGIDPETIEDMREALKQIAELQDDKIEMASGEILYVLLDNKVGIARAALAKAKLT